MKTKLVLALVAILSAGIVLILWKPFSAPPATQPPSERVALGQPAKGWQESPANETSAPMKPWVASRNAPAQPQVQTPAATVTTDLLGQIQSALALLGDPRGLVEIAAGPLLDTLTALAWLAFCIHGDE